MALIRCKNCDSSYGRDYGNCPHCTPKEFIEFQEFVHKFLESYDCDDFHLSVSDFLNTFGQFSWLKYVHICLMQYDRYVTALKSYNENLPKGYEEQQILSNQELYDMAIALVNKKYETEKGKLKREYEEQIEEIQALINF